MFAIFSLCDNTSTWVDSETRGKRFFSFGTAEFFIDALGSLHVGSCSDVIVNHASKIIMPWSKTVSQKAYDKFRYSSSSADNDIHKEDFYFKNRFKCMTSHWNLGCLWPCEGKMWNDRCFQVLRKIIVILYSLFTTVALVVKQIVWTDFVLWTDYDSLG